MKNDGAVKEKELETLPASLSVALADGSCETLIEKGSALPALAEHVFSAPYNNPHAICAHIYAGERLLASENTILKKIRLVVHRTAGDRVRVTLRLSVKKNGEAEVWMYDHGSHHQKRRTIANSWIPEEQSVSIIDTEDIANAETDAVLEERYRLIHKAKAEIFCAQHLSRAEKKSLGSDDKKLIKGQTKTVRKLIRKAVPVKMTEGETKKLEEEVRSLKNLLP